MVFEHRLSLKKGKTNTLGKALFIYLLKLLKKSVCLIKVVILYKDKSMKTFRHRLSAILSLAPAGFSQSVNRGYVKV